MKAPTQSSRNWGERMRPAEALTGGVYSRRAHDVNRTRWRGARGFRAPEALGRPADILRLRGPRPAPSGRSRRHRSCSRLELTLQRIMMD